MYNYLEIKFDKNDKNNKNEENEKYYKIIWDNLTNLIDYIILNKYRNIKVLTDIFKKIKIEDFVKFKNKYGYDKIDTLLLSGSEYLLNYDVYNNQRLNIFKDHKIFNIIKTLYEKNHNLKKLRYVENFIETLGSNINKLTYDNIDKLFNMYILIYSKMNNKKKRFNGFEKWGPGNNGNPEKNLLNHFNKHVLNGDENWIEYLKAKKITLEMYERFAIETSKCMKNRMIHTNGAKVYLSGLFEKVLIIGRLDNNYGLGISSCYIISDKNYNRKMNVFEKNACFKF